MKVCIHKAIGYAMPLGEFYQHVRLPISSEWPFVIDQLRESLSGVRVRGGEIELGMVTGDDSLADLFIHVGEYGVGHIMIFPTCIEKEAWYRRNDYMDRVKTIYGIGPSGTHYLSGPIDQNGGFMDGNGVAVHPSAKGTDPALTPGIPRIMRWWLLRYGVFDLTGIAKLRPMLAEWWT